MLVIERLSAAQAAAALDNLVTLLQNVVDDGASIGFLLPLAAEEARAYWQGIVADLERSPRVLLVARLDGVLVGSIQLEPAMRKNGLHRAEVQKLMVHTAARRRGIAHGLLMAIEDAARSLGSTLLVLDTVQGDAGDNLYRTRGYIEAGVIPQYARSFTGALDATVVFYKIL